MSKNGLPIWIGGAACLVVTVSAAHAGTLTTLYSFKGGADGGSVMSGVISYGGLLYGTTPQGGSEEAGTVYSLDPATGIAQFPRRQ